MGLKALEGLERHKKKLHKPEKSKQPRDFDTPELKVKTPKPAPQATFPDNEDEVGHQIVRTPRLVPKAMVNKVEAKSTGLAMTDPLGSKRETQERREQVVQWMLNGHTHEDRLMSITELAESLGAPMETIEKDLVAVKGAFEKFYQESNVKDITALAFMLMEMKFQDRGRALSLYNLIQGDIQAADDNEAEFRDPKTGKMKKFGALTGRDRAAMYSSALAALDLANKATNGIDNLIKLSGGFQKLQQVIHAKTVNVNNGSGNMAVSMADLQDFAATTLGTVLPSARKLKKVEDVPASIQLTDEDEEILRIGELERGDR